MQNDRRADPVRAQAFADILELLDRESAKALDTGSIEVDDFVMRLRAKIVDLQEKPQS